MLKSTYLDVLRARIRDDWLPQYLLDEGYEGGGYLGGEEHLEEIDAQWFLRAIDEQIVTLLPKARLSLPASSVLAMIFWEHSRTTSPRPVSLHREGILSAGMAARLNLEYGWPIAQMGFEYPPERGDGRRAFDLGALDPFGSLALAGEAKKAQHELKRVLSVMQECGSSGPHEHDPEDKARINGHRKWQGLIRCRPSVFFTFGPGEDWSIFRVLFANDGRLALEPGDRELLRYSHDLV
jgi:hypothetical protein